MYGGVIEVGNWLNCVKCLNALPERRPVKFLHTDKMKLLPVLMQEIPVNYTSLKLLCNLLITIP